jgi:hypothetical protein
MGQPTGGGGSILSWMPNASNLEVSQSIFRELLAVFIMQLRLIWIE